MASCSRRLRAQARARRAPPGTWTDCGCLDASRSPLLSSSNGGDGALCTILNTKVSTISNSKNGEEGTTLPTMAAAHARDDGSQANRRRADHSETYLRLREAITGGRFQPNERLVEAQLVDLLGPGRSSIRAALVRLDQEGLVTRQPNRGARVRLIS